MDLLDTRVYELIGEDGFERLTAAFYRRVAGDDILRPMYPEEELLAAQHRLRDFLIQRFGGPFKYSETRGHPRLRLGETWRGAGLTLTLNGVKIPALGRDGQVVKNRIFDQEFLVTLNQNTQGSVE